MYHLYQMTLLHKFPVQVNLLQWRNCAVSGNFTCVCQLILVAVCQNSGLIPAGKQTDTAALSSAVSQDGISLQITGVEKGDEVVRLKFTAVKKFTDEDQQTYGQQRLRRL